MLNLLPAPVVYIEGNTFWKHIVKVDASCDGKTNYKMLMGAMLGAAISYATNGYTVLVDFSMTPRFVKGAFEKLRHREITLKYVVIKPEVEVCAQRAATRKKGVIENYDGPVLGLYELFNEAGGHILDDHSGDAKTIAERVCAGLDEGKFVVT